MKKQEVIFVTGSRADYGIVRRYLSLLCNHQDINLSIIITGALLCEEYGHQADLIYHDGFHVAAEIEIEIDSRSNTGVIHSMAIALDKFGRYFSANKPDLLIILGDRYEMLSVATAAAMNHIPILHLHGGEATFGNYDEFIRHSITKMSLYHITSTEEFKKRVIQLGEEPYRVYNLGALGAENCLDVNERMVAPEIIKLSKTPFFVVLFHPETLTNERTEDQIKALLDAIDQYNDFMYVFLGSNADTHSNIIRNQIRYYVENHNNCLYFENLPTNDYHYLLKYSVGLIGNSSSGLIEAPSLGTYTINIGHRQDGRVKGNSVIDVKCNTESIKAAIGQVLQKCDRDKIINPYYMSNSADNYCKTTLKILQDLENGANNEPKRFYDI